MNIKKIILISYFISILCCNMIIDMTTDQFVEWYMETMDYGNPAILIGRNLIAEMIYVIITSILAIIVKFIKNIDNKLKKIFYLLPLYTIILWLPIMYLSAEIVNFFYQS